MCTGQGSNQVPLGPKSDALTTAPLCHTKYTSTGKMIKSTFLLLLGMKQNTCYFLSLKTINTLKMQVFDFVKRYPSNKLMIN